MALITISRGTFGGGRDVAEKLAVLLSYSCVSREMIISDAAREFGIPEEQLLDATSELPGGGGQGTEQGGYDIQYIRAAILARAVGQQVVYHGHGGHLLLAGIPGLLRVRIIAGMEYRVDHAMRNKNISRDEAAALIVAIDKKRQLWSRRVWGVEWHDPSLYDLVLNLDHMSVDTAARIIAGASEADEFADSEDQQQILAGELIKSKIWVALANNKPTRTVRIALEVKDGEVIISGDVGSKKLAEAVVTVTESVAGVKRVTNNMSIGSSWLW